MGGSISDYRCWIFAEDRELLADMDLALKMMFNYTESDVDEIFSLMQTEVVTAQTADTKIRDGWAVYSVLPEIQNQL